MCLPPCDKLSEMEVVRLTCLTRTLDWDAAEVVNVEVDTGKSKHVCGEAARDPYHNILPSFIHPNIWYRIRIDFLLLY